MIATAWTWTVFVAGLAAAQASDPSCPLTAEQLKKSAIGWFGDGDGDYYAPCNGGVWSDGGVCATALEPTIKWTEASDIDMADGATLNLEMHASEKITACDAQMANISHDRKYAVTICVEGGHLVPTAYENPDANPEATINPQSTDIQMLAGGTDGPSDGACGTTGDHAFQNDVMCTTYGPISAAALQSMEFTLEDSKDTSSSSADVHVRVEEQIFDDNGVSANTKSLWSEKRRLTVHPPEDGTWSVWGECDADCDANEGIGVQTRQCTEPLYNGAPCEPMPLNEDYVGSGPETRDCMNTACLGQEPVTATSLRTQYNAKKSTNIFSLRSGKESTNVKVGRQQLRAMLSTLNGAVAKTIIGTAVAATRAAAAVAANADARADALAEVFDQCAAYADVRPTQISRTINNMQSASNRDLTNIPPGCEQYEMDVDFAEVDAKKDRGKISTNAEVRRIKRGLKRAYREQFKNMLIRLPRSTFSWRRSSSGGVDDAEDDEKAEAETQDVMMLPSLEDTDAVNSFSAPPHGTPFYCVGDEAVGNGDPGACAVKVRGSDDPFTVRPTYTDDGEADGMVISRSRNGDTHSNTLTPINPFRMVDGVGWTLRALGTVSFADGSCDGNISIEHGNPGDCDDGDGGEVVNGATCTIGCDPGYTPSGTTVCNDSFLTIATCEDINECETYDCGAESMCVNTEGSFNCVDEPPSPPTQTYDVTANKRCGGADAHGGTCGGLGVEYCLPANSNWSNKDDWQCSEGATCYAGSGDRVNWSVCQAMCTQDPDCTGVSGLFTDAGYDDLAANPESSADHPVRCWFHSDNPLAPGSTQAKTACGIAVAPPPPPPPPPPITTPPPASSPDEGDDTMPDPPSCGTLIADPDACRTAQLAEVATGASWGGNFPLPGLPPGCGVSEADNQFFWNSDAGDPTQCNDSDSVPVANVLRVDETGTRCCGDGSAGGGDSGDGDGGGGDSGDGDGDGGGGGGGSSTPLFNNINAEEQRVYSSATDENGVLNFHAYMDTNGDAHARLSLDTYKYTGQEQELAMSTVYFGECGTFDAETQLKRTTLAIGGGDDFDEYDRITENNLNGTPNDGGLGLGNQDCYAQKSAVLSGSDGNSNYGPSSYGKLFKTMGTSNLYPSQSDLDTDGSFWGATTCSIEGGGEGDFPVCAHQTGDVADRVLFTGEAPDAVFRYSADAPLDALRRKCNNVGHVATEGSATTTFKVAHEIIRPSQRQGDYPSDVPATDKFQQTCQEHSYSVAVNKGLRAVSGGEYSQEIEFKVLEAKMVPCDTITTGSISDPNACAALPGGCRGGGASTYHKLQVELRIDFPDDVTGTFIHTGIEDATVHNGIGAGGVSGSNRQGDGTFQFNKYNFAQSMGAVGVELKTDRTGYTGQILTIETDCLDASIVGDGSQCNAGLFGEDPDYSLNFRFRACKAGARQCLAGGDATDGTFTYTADGEMSRTGGGCEDQCIDVRSDVTSSQAQWRGLTYPPGSKYFPLQLTIHHNECPASYSDKTYDKTIQFSAATVELYEAAFHPAVANGDRLYLGFQRTDANVVGGMLNGISLLSNTVTAGQDNIYGQGETVVAALVADKLSARAAYTVWIKTAKLCRFDDEPGDGITGSAGTGCTGVGAEKVYDLIVDGAPVEKIGGTNYFGVQACKYGKRTQLSAYKASAAGGSEDVTDADSVWKMDGNPFASDANMCPDYDNTAKTSNAEFGSGSGVCDSTKDGCGRGRAGARWMCDWDLDAGKATGDCVGATCGDVPAGAAWDALSFRTDYMVAAAAADPGRTSDRLVPADAPQYWVLDLHGFAADCAGVDMSVKPQSTHLRHSLRSITTHTFSASDTSGAEASLALVVRGHETPTADPTRSPTTVEGLYKKKKNLDLTVGLLVALVVAMIAFLAYRMHKKKKEDELMNKGVMNKGARYMTRSKTRQAANPAESVNMAVPRFSVPSFGGGKR